MIYDYEKEILKFINKAIPDIKLATYSSEEDLLKVMSSVTYYPSFYYNRVERDWEFNKVYRVRDESKVHNFVPFLQPYTGYILTETQLDAMNLASNLRFYWNENPYLSVPFLDDTLKVGLRLLYIRLRDDRNPDDRKGAKRIVEFRWESQLFVSDEDTTPLVTDYSIMIIANGETKLIIK